MFFVNRMVRCVTLFSIPHPFEEEIEEGAGKRKRERKGERKDGKVSWAQSAPVGQQWGKWWGRKMHRKQANYVNIGTENRKERLVEVVGQVGQNPPGKIMLPDSINTNQ